MNNFNYHNTHFIYDNRREIVWKEITKYIQRYIPYQSKVIELGAGYCDFINHIQAKQKTAVDIWSGVKKYANSSVKTLILDLDLEGYKLAGNYDVVIASNFLEHFAMDSIRRILIQTRKILVKGGKLILIQPNFRLSYKNYFDDYTHKTIFSDISISSLLKEIGFSIEHIEPGFTPLTLQSKFPISRFLIRIYLKSPWRPWAGQMLIIANK